MNSGRSYPPEEEEDKAEIEKYSKLWKKKFLVTHQDVEMKEGATHYGMMDQLRDFNENISKQLKK